MNTLLDDDVLSPGRPVFLGALRTALGRSPVWIFCWLGPLLLALVLCDPWRAWFDGALAQRYAPGEALAGLDANFRADHARALDALGASTASAAAGLGFLMMLFGVFSAGGWLQVFLERTQGHSLRRFFWGGGRYFWRFLRLWVGTLITLALLGWVLYGWPWKLAMRLLFGAQDGDLEVLTSELSAVRLTWFRDGLFALGFGLVMAWGDYTRTRLALLDTRSALWAGLCTWGLILLHPVRTMRPMALLFVVEAALIWTLGYVSRRLNLGLTVDSGTGSILILFAIGQAALILRGIVRGARYHAATQVSRALVPPLAAPDPWADRVGGPGGPQYPIDLADDYGVSV